MPVAESTLRSIAQSLAVDVATGEVVAALREAGIRSVVLRGPALARQVYAAGELRPYVDVDLLVAPGEEEAANAVLSQPGFALGASAPPPAARPRVAPRRCCRRPAPDALRRRRRAGRAVGRDRGRERGGGRRRHRGRGALACRGRSPARPARRAPRPPAGG